MTISSNPSRLSARGLHTVSERSRESMITDNFPGYTPEQESALTSLVKAFGIRYSSDFSVRLKVHEGNWTEAEISPNERLVRRSENRRRV